jgi:cobalt-zinc-cadmium efflux system protein
MHVHEHRGQRYHRAFAIGTALNVAFVVVEFLCGVWADSLALIADAGHNLGDVVSLLLAWGAFVIAGRTPSRRFTYGLRKSTVLASLLSAVLLLVAMGAITWEAIGRIGAPGDPAGRVVLVVAGIGVLVNAASAWLFYADRKDDLNIQGAFLHLAADAAVSLGVVIAAALMLATGWNWLDPVVSLGIVAVILVGTWGLLRDSVQLSLDAVPKGIDLEEVDAWLRAQPGVEDLHDLHVWAMSTTQTALTAHLVMPATGPGLPAAAALQTAAAAGDHDPLVAISCGLQERFGIGHTTIQVEAGAAACRSC